MKNVAKSKAEQKYAELQKKDVTILSDIEKASRLRSEKSAKLRKLRLDKEAEEKLAAESAAAEKAKAKSAADPKKVKRVRRATVSQAS